MDYGFGKTYVLPGKFTALNGTIQHYCLTTSADLEVSFKDPKNPTEDEVKAYEIAQANLLRVLETLRTYGGQPVITAVEGKKVHFTLEQPNVYGKGGLAAEINGDQQVSKKVAEVKGVPGLIAGAKAKIAELFTNIKDVEDKANLFVSVDVKEAF